MKTAPCGLNCSDCSLFRAANSSDEAKRLAAVWRAAGYERAVADWFKCQGCHGPDHLVWSGDCQIRACCKQRQALSNCSQCDQFACGKLTSFERDGDKRHLEAVESLRKLRKDNTAQSK